MDSDLAGRSGRLKPDFSARKGQATVALAASSRAPERESESEARQRRSHLAVRLTAAAGILSLGLAIAGSVLPVYNGETISNTTGVTFVTETYIAAKGAWVLGPILAPLLLSVVVAVALRRARVRGDERSRMIAWAAIGILAVFGLVMILSIGAFILVIAGLLGGAAVLSAPGGAQASPEPVSPEAAAPRVRDRARPEHLW
jgi:hypothetical protein